MFASKGKGNNEVKNTNTADNDINAFLGVGSQFEGRMVFEENMRIDGAFRGEIASKKLLVTGNTAELQAEVAVGSLIMSGRFSGKIKAESRVELRAPATVEGDIEAPVVVIEDGVVFNGAVKMAGIG
jgi:cytoskeletal protein CcmA (bactofilin family)